MLSILGLIGALLLLLLSPITFLHLYYPPLSILPILFLPLSSTHTTLFSHYRLPKRCTHTLEKEFVDVVANTSLCPNPIHCTQSCTAHASTIVTIVDGVGFLSKVSITR